LAASNTWNLFPEPQAPAKHLYGINRRVACTIRVDESSDQRSNGVIGPCKTQRPTGRSFSAILRAGAAMRTPKAFLRSSLPDELIFRSRRDGALLETTILNQGLYPALKALALPKGGLHGFRRGCDRRWELAGINPAVIRQPMGHTSQRMTTLYGGEIPLDQGCAAFSSKTGNEIVVLENMENAVAA
jgi:integrase